MESHSQLVSLHYCVGKPFTCANRYICVRPVTSYLVLSPLRTSVFYPFPPALAPPFVPLSNRTYDVALVAWHKVGRPLLHILQHVFPRHRSMWLTHEPLQSYKSLYRKVDTTFGASLPQKFDILARTRVAVVYNAYMDRKENVKIMLKKIGERPALRNNLAFSHLTQPQRGVLDRSFLPLLPQLKSRTIEAAACGAMMMVYNDGFNVIEQYFVPDLDFLYWYNATDFGIKLQRVLANFDAYSPMIQRARTKALSNYTVQKWVQQYILPFVNV
eukprot:NODE_2057_length_1525_cov_51.129815_g1959_i0.p1 GENE.NODE_2057_length_1525_cov_51.129815_g1959_i0~~NODE_2057_length_1525_cov_51.129815_g1959_i0.p1  ORF type:complete len:272 (-),score=15.28 NODE_2057_length_1525_cov_51.129815_g1959_i0:21-836(-)